MLHCPAPRGARRTASLARAPLFLPFATVLAIAFGIGLTPTPAGAQSNTPLGQLFSLFLKPNPQPQPQVRTERRPYPGNAVRPGSRGGRGSSHRSYAPYVPDHGRSKRRARHRGQYRTMCVRTCDGYYWPISFGATSRQFSRDRNECHSSCSSETRLFVMTKHSDSIGRMHDLSGRRYSKLENAFRYRKQLVGGCGCAPQPWTAEARSRHRQYALLEREREDAEPQAIGALKPVEFSDLARISLPIPGLEDADVRGDPLRLAVIALPVRKGGRRIAVSPDEPVDTDDRSADVSAAEPATTEAAEARGQEGAAAAARTPDMAESAHLGPHPEAFGVQHAAEQTARGPQREARSTRPRLYHRRRKSVSEGAADGASPERS